MEGDSVTLHTDITQIQRDHQILWMFGTQETRIAEIYKKSMDILDRNEIFRDRLKLDTQTGSLIITDITIAHTGLYKLVIISNRGTSYKRFNVIVFGHLPIPVITRISNSSNCSTLSERSSSSKCVLLLCSVLNVTDVSLSWYKGNSLLSSIGVSDLNIRLSLPLEVEYQDTNTYSCVVSNTITKQTQHLDINYVCQTCLKESEVSLSSYITVLIISGVLLVFVSSCVIHFYCRKSQQDKQGKNDLCSECSDFVRGKCMKKNESPKLDFF
ncbi:uncharacterized protein [Misgurnus anguillicaudatus]|uniref:uncharacterized protein n=1 Tax=Misgurnus anguillicaudatus TaxID=75329 RepID=UPI003CCFCA3E